MPITADSSAQLDACLEAARHSYVTCPVALSEDVLAPPFFWRVPLAEAEERFGNREYGVYCGGNAWHFVQVLAAQEVEAFTFNFGLEAGANGLTHVIVLVRLDDDVIALDPYFGDYLAASDTGQPLPFGRYLEELRATTRGAAAGRWTRLHGLGRKTLLLGDPRSIARPGEDWLRPGEATVEGLHGGRLVVSRSPASTWIEAMSSRECAPSPTACERAVLDPLTVADTSGQSLGLGEEDVLGPPAILELLRELGLDGGGEEPALRRRSRAGAAPRRRSP